MSRKYASETPNTSYGPATGVPSPAPKNQALGEERYTGACTPGTADHAQPGHASGGPGHEGCNHE